MSYLTRAVGIDLAPVSSGLACLTQRVGSWETQVMDAGVVHLNRAVGDKQPTFKQQLDFAQKVAGFVYKHRPDIVGIEDYTNQRESHVAFSMAQLNGMVRLLLYQAGWRQLLIAPARLSRLVVPAGERFDYSKPNKNKYVNMKIDWVAENLKVELQGKPKEISDMSDACLYALVAACFFAMKWMKQEPPLTWRQKEMFTRRSPVTGYKDQRKNSGLLDAGRYLIRNLEKEAETYTPEWLKHQPKDPVFVGM